MSYLTAISQIGKERQRDRQGQVQPHSQEAAELRTSRVSFLSFFFFFFKIYLFIYLFMIDIEREKGRDTGGGRSRLHAGA